MSDLNDLYIFSQVVERRGFTGAAKALAMAPSSVSRRIDKLEGQLGIRLVQRTTRQFAITELGMEFYGYCVKAVAEANAAYEMAACAKATPSGMIRVSCSTLVAQLLVGPLIPRFVLQNPQVRVALEAMDREVDIEENFDLCIRIRKIPSENSALIMRSLGIVQRVLVASPAFLGRHGHPATPAEASRLPTLSYGSTRGPHLWRLVDAREREILVRHEPTLIADDIGLIRQSAVEGLGVVELPLVACVNELRQGLLEIVLPNYPAPLWEIQAIYPSRRGMRPAARSFLDFLAAQEFGEVPEWQVKRHHGDGPHECIRFWTRREALAQLATLNRSATRAEPQKRSVDRVRTSFESPVKSLRIA